LDIASPLLCGLMLTTKSIKSTVQRSLLNHILQVLDNRELLSAFKAGIQQVPHSSSDADTFADEAVVCRLYNAITVKMTEHNK